MLFSWMNLQIKIYTTHKFFELPIKHNFFNLLFYFEHHRDESVTLLGMFFFPKA